jgi:hypothetical protein
MYIKVAVVCMYIHIYVHTYICTYVSIGREASLVTFACIKFGYVSGTKSAAG